MRYLFILLTGMTLFINTAHACVTYNPQTGTYTVDQSGCVE